VLGQHEGWHARLSAFLGANHDIANLTLVTHGSPGELRLGVATVTVDAFVEEGVVGEIVRVLRAAIAPDADFCIYACNAGAGESGKELMTKIADTLGVTVWASDSLVGNQTKGGSWELTMRVEPGMGKSVFTAEVEAYQHTLAAPVLENANTTVTIPETAGQGSTSAIVIDVDVNDGDGGGTDAGISYSIVGGDPGGAFGIVADGTITVDDESLVDFEVQDQFILTVQAVDGASESATFTFTINVDDIAPQPVAPGGLIGPDNFTVSESAANGASVGTVQLQAALVGDMDSTFFMIADASNPDVDMDGNLAFGINAATGEITVNDTDDLDFETQSLITIEVNHSDGTSEAGTNVVVTLTDAPDAPVAFDDTATTDEDSQVLIDVLANDTDQDTAFSIVDTNGGNGTIAFGGGTVAYTPNAFSFGTLTSGESATDVFTYTISDGTFTSTADVTVVITGINDPSTVNDDTATAQEDGPAINIDVLGNDTDPDNTLTVLTAFGAAEGSIVATGGGTVSYDPNGQFETLAVGDTAVDTFSYVVSDGVGMTFTAQVTVTIQGNNDPVTLRDDNVLAGEDAVTTISVLDNDSDADFDSLTIINGTDPAAGGDVIGGPFTVVFDPNGDFDSLGDGETDIVTFTYTAGDNNGSSDVATVTVTVSGANDAPTAADDNATTNEDATTTGALLTNDTDVEGDSLTVLGASGGTGDVTVGGGTYSYDPNGQFESLDTGESVTDVFSYTISDGNGATDTANVTVTVTGVNDAPVAGDDTATVNEDGSVTINIFTNDTDPDDLLSVDAFSGGPGAAEGGGTFTFDASGSYDTLDAGDTVIETFTYSLSDGEASSNEATITVTIQGLNDDPSAADDATLTINEDISGNIDVLANDTDIDGDDTPNFSGGTSAEGASVTFGGGTVNYDPNDVFQSLAGGESATDVVTYTVTDGNGGSDTAQFTVLIDGVNDAPTANDDDLGTVSEDDGNAVIGNVLTNDSDVDASDTLTLVTIDDTGVGGDVTFLGNGAISFDPNGQYETLGAGESVVESLQYTISDGNGATDTGTFSVTVIGENDAPTANIDSTLTINEDNSGNIDVLSNDTDIDGDALTITDVNGAIGDTDFGGGSISYDANGFFDTLAPGQSDTDIFTYTITDGNGGTDSANVTVTVTGVNDDPNAADNFFGADEDDGDALLGNVLTNDTDVDNGDSVTVQAFDDSSVLGDVTFATNGNFSFDPNAQYETLSAGETLIETVTYTVGDTFGGTDIATVSLTVTGENDPVTANDDTLSLNEDSSNSVNVLANDSDIDANDDLTVNDATVISGGGSISFGGGSISFDANGEFESLDDGESATALIEYTVSDGEGSTDIATVTVEVTGVNDAPTAADDTASTNEEGSVNIDVLSNDTDVDIEGLTIVGVSGGSGSVGFGGGTIGYNANGQFETLGVGESTTDVFTYTVSDGDATDTAQVTVTVTGVNDLPTAADDTITVNEDDGAVTLDLLSNDTDIDVNDSLTIFDVAFQSGGGDLTLGGGTVTFDPNGQFETLGVGESATVTFEYTITDGEGGTDTADVTITVLGQNDAPTADSDAATTNEDVGVNIDVLANDSDVDVNDSLTIDGTSGAIGDVTIGGGTLGYDPNGQFDTLAVGESATDVFTYTITDGNGGSDTADVTVTVTGVNDAPTGVDDDFTTNEEVAATGNVLTNDTDVDGDTLTVNGFSSLPTVAGAAVTLNPDGSFSYDPNGAFETLAVGTSATDVFSYIVSDGNGATDTADVTVTITGVNDPVTANDDSAVTNEDTAATIDILANDTDIDLGDVITLLSIDDSGITGDISFGGGTVGFDPNGAYDTLAAGTSVTEVFSYTISDGNGSTDTANVTLTVLGVNDPPSAADDNFTTNEDVPVSGGLLANDTDPDGDTLTVSGLGSLPTIGGVAVTVNPNGSFTYDPNGALETLAVGQSQTDVFSYIVSDGNGATDTANITVTITGVNDAPNAFDDTLSITEDTDLGGSNVLTGVGLGGGMVADTDIDNGDDALLFVKALDGSSANVGVTDYELLSGAKVTLLSDGSLDYDARGAFDFLQDGVTAIDTFTYTISDTNGGTSIATVTATITGVNDQYQAGDDTFAVNEDDAVQPFGVMANDTDPDDPDGPAYTVSGLNGGGFTGTATFTLGGGNATLDTDGSFTFDPNGAYETLGVGETALETFTYSVSDGSPTPTTSATVTVVINGENDPVVAADDAGATNEDTALNIDVLANDSDTDVNDALTILGADSALVSTGGGTLSYNPVGTFESLAQGQTDVDVFTYTVSDGNGSTDTADVTVTITGVNDAPIAGFDFTFVDEDGPAVTVDALANDTDVDDGSSLTITGLFDLTGPAGGDFSTDGTNIFYDPNGQYETLGVGESAVDGVLYTVSDEFGAIDTQTVLVFIDGENDPIDAIDDNAVVNEDGATAIDVLANDTDVDVNDTFTILGVSGGIGDASLVPTTATTTISDDLSDPTDVDSFTFTVDVDGLVNLDVIGTPDTELFLFADDGMGGLGALVANNDDGGPGLNPALSLDLDAGVYHAVVGSFNLDETDARNGTNPDGVSSGAYDLFISGTGSAEYDANGQFEFLAVGESATDVFTYTVSDGQGSTDTAQVTVTVTGVNDAPTANDDSVISAENGSVVFDPLANDSDVDATDVLTVLGIDETGLLGEADLANGTIGYNPDGQFETLSVGDTAIDTFTYLISDGNGGQDSATVSVTVTGENDPVTGLDDDAIVNEDASVLIDVLANDTDIDINDTFSVIGVSGGVGDVTFLTGSATFGGSVSYDTNGQFETLAVGESATDVFTYTVSDGQGSTDTAQVTVTVTGVNDAPDAIDDDGVVTGSAITNEDAATVVNVLGNDTDIDTSDILTVIGTDDSGSLGSVSLTEGQVTYDPNGAFETLAVGESTTDVFTYTISDGNGGTDSASVTMTVTGVNDAPTALDDTDLAQEDGPAITVDVLANDLDIDASDTLTVIGVSGEGTIGSVSLSEGEVSYDPNGQFEFLAIGESATDTFTYLISDGNGGTDSATVTVTIAGANDAPDALDDVVLVHEDDTATILGGLLTNDTDVDASDTLTIIGVNAEGTIGDVEFAGGSVSYDPNGLFSDELRDGETAIETFTYTISDGNGGTDSATVTIVIEGENDGVITPPTPPAEGELDADFKGDDTSETIKGDDKSDDFICGFGGDDLLRGQTGDDFILGGDDDDEIHGGKDNDTLLGEDGNDFLIGGRGNDLLFGGDGDDILEGRKDDDILVGGAGNDILDGNMGNDIFVFGPAEDDDTIVKFKSGEDQIAFTDPGIEFGDLVITEVDDGILIDHGGGTILIEKLNGADALTAADFIFDYDPDFS